MLKKFKIFCIFLLFLLIPQVQAIGSLQKNNFLEIEKGGIANFEILFWNTENISYFVKIEVRKKPENFFVLIEPSEFLLYPSSQGPPYEEGEYVSLPSGDFKAFPVNVYVKDFGETGEQEVFISALIGNEKNELSFLMEKNFKFKVKVNFSSQVKEANETKPFSVPINISSFEKGVIDLKPLFYFLIVLIFALISILVYKHA